MIECGRSSAEHGVVPAKETRMRIVGWLKGRFDTYLRPDPSLSFQDPEPEEEEGPTEPVVALRFRVTTVDEAGKDDRVLFVYGRDEAEVRSKLPAALRVGRVEPAGQAVDGVVHFPPDELRAAMASMQDGRKAPGA